MENGGLQTASGDDKFNPFPFSSLTPKRDTGILSFLRKYPDYDGRGTIIAVLDTGVDPAAPGLQVTPDGKPKVISRYDCSGAGDVDTSTTVTPDEEGFIALPSGRKLKVPVGWDNPCGSFFVGVKPLYDLYTVKVKERVEAKRKELNWESAHRSAVSSATNEAFSFSNNKSNNGNSNATAAESTTSITGNGETPPSPAPTPTSSEEKLEKEEVEARIEVLDGLEKKYKDWGPLLDCILFQDSSSSWNVALNLGDDLTTVKLLREYSLTQDHMELTPLDKLTISVNVWDGGKLLEIVGMCGSHGTHVSSIAAAYFPENPSMNGVAPGAQVISLTIGDNRLASMETGTAMSRAIAFLMKNSDKVDVINMSYGEHACWCANGRIGELMREVVDKYGITWICSGGNHGPALSTVGTPPWICSNNIIGVGAYVSPEMMGSEYSMREKPQSMPYTWSSRGPTLDGGIGISICAPGGAITTVPNFTLRNSQLMNGTSMAAPHVAGLVALLQSAAKARQIPYSPFSIKRALEASAVPVPGTDAFSVGAGLVQAEGALDKLTVYSKSPERDVRFEIKIGGTNAQGIYIRDPTLIQKEYSVSVEPVFLNTNEIDQNEKISFRLNLLLTSSASWLLIPEFLDISNISRSFNVRPQIDGLSVGVHYAKIEAFDASDVSRGPVFTVHVTAVIPQEATKVTNLTPISYEPGYIKRHFLLIPKGATQASLSLRNESPGTVCRIVIHAVTLVQGQSCKYEEFYKMCTISAPDEAVFSFKVQEGKVMELVIGRWWADTKEPTTIASTLTLKSFVVNKSEVSISAADAFSVISISTAFQSEDITPTAPLKNQVCAVRPTNVKISSLNAERDAFPNMRVTYELVATYVFNVSRSTQLQVICSLICDTLYEGEYEAQLWMLFDSNKRFLASGDAYPNKWTAKLEKGEYTLKLHVRHEKRELLERFMNGFPNFQGDSILPALPILLSFKLTTPINMSVHQSTYDAMIQKKGSGWSQTIKRGTSFSLTLGTHLVDKNLKALPCSLQTHFMSGSLCLAAKDDKRSTPIRLFFPEPPPKHKTDKGKDELAEQMRDIKLTWMGKASKEESFKLYTDLLETWPNYLGVLTARLGFLEMQRKESVTAEIDEEMKSLIQKIIGSTDKPKLLAYFGSKNGDPDPKVKAQMERSRNAFLDALVKKGTIFGEDIEGCWTEACAFVEPGENKVLDLTVKHAMSRGQFGRAAKFLLKTDETSDRDKKLLEIYEAMGWKHAVWLLQEHTAFKAATKDYRRF